MGSPSTLDATIEALSFCDEDTESADAGQLVRMKLKGVDEARVAQGMVICDDGLAGVTEATAQLVFTFERGIVCAGHKAMCHAHTCVEEATITDLVCTVDKKTGCVASRRPRFVRGGEVAIARISLTRPICIQPLTEDGKFGRIVLRVDSKTVAFGKILSIQNENKQGCDAPYPKV